MRLLVRERKYQKSQIDFPLSTDIGFSILFLSSPSSSFVFSEEATITR